MNQLYIMNKNAPKLSKKEADLGMHKLTSMKIVGCNALTERAEYCRV